MLSTGSGSGSVSPRPEPGRHRPDDERPGRRAGARIIRWRSRPAAAGTPAVYRKGLRSMAERDRANADTTRNRTMRSAAVTPSEDTERPDGLAFDVGKGPTCPEFRQVTRLQAILMLHTEQAVREAGGGVGLAVPDDRGRKAVDPPRRCGQRTLTCKPGMRSGSGPSAVGRAGTVAANAGVAVTVNVGLAWRSLTGNVIRPRVRGIGRRS